MNYRTKPIWIYGKHTCTIAIKNLDRICYELIITENFFKKNLEIIQCANKRNIKFKIADNNLLNSILGRNINHQGIALKVNPILQNNTDIHHIISHNNKNSTILILDQITDVYNVGSIIRSSACFNVDAVIMSYYNSPSDNCVIAKTSSGAVDLIPIIQVTNIVQTIKTLQKSGYWCYGFDIQAKQLLHEVNFYSKKIIVLGSEEKGIRKLVKENCDFLLKIPISQKINSLNVSNAAAIALYYTYSQNLQNNNVHK
ncbi:23S rRNA (guanosine(2251)-2'-O)-methyltransferase RlmB [Neoehrlichia mikurensis]|uniref:23S rRNA (Guanosine(2251)-2'-O)-methyltransferase RlmB n=1 Tax=Neoehrlichia mikurensis TaxID=89586 RepID=A0A9Q9BTF8_9RICK|nr:23S rRNA (guanosine(2251)-2'-O)-methyltransferase RlmB [Neoehrlichia mikurensis]QXK91788.1 23S rRNA (guanosine(2251)-2'-O)-methyltransferase RlmB [Neoehrlichia mikurensis]QXK93001.1 23S rRNA (guanosine(2251)-2'-O)-methyltransferase RlmB [Neoehrlichia mikurensis]QXK93478.1 23S rRNA (guanosine(2251)-2'-O)-methyltransferase RlmB [Neoehrlichia mikurensis]UTO55567.1 23S rRNA (guanosine(2251)-2'-O)-methyltransferase RlmB [Neoehrlichia mikurensis]UTO56488.1 23S rRNA (guanosine(2251)-2'-O)-methyltr